MKKSIKYKFKDKKVQEWLLDFQVTELMGNMEDVLHRLDRLEKEKE